MPRKKATNYFLQTIVCKKRNSIEVAQKTFRILLFTP